MTNDLVVKALKAIPIRKAINILAIFILAMI